MFSANTFKCKENLVVSQTNLGFMVCAYHFSFPECFNNIQPLRFTAVPPLTKWMNAWTDHSVYICVCVVCLG